MTIDELDEKYRFRRDKLAAASGISGPTLQNIFKHKTNGQLSTMRRFVNALPISAEERQELINSLFEKE